MTTDGDCWLVKGQERKQDIFPPTVMKIIRIPAYEYAPWHASEAHRAFWFCHMYCIASAASHFSLAHYSYIHYNQLHASHLKPDSARILQSNVAAARCESVLRVAKIESVCANDRLLQRLKMMLFLYINNKSLEQTGGKKSMYSAHRCTHRKANTVFTLVSVAAWKCMIQHHLTSWQGLLFPPLSFCVGEWQAAPTCLQPPQATDTLQHTCGQTGH